MAAWVEVQVAATSARHFQHGSHFSNFAHGISSTALSRILAQVAATSARHFQHGVLLKWPALRILRTRSFGTYKAVEGTMGLLWDIVTVQRVSYNTENTRNKCKIPKANNC